SLLESTDQEHFTCKLDLNFQHPSQGKFTALHRAVVTGEDDLIQTLLAAGASPLKKDTCGNTPLDWAISAKNRLTIRLLTQRTLQLLEELTNEKNGMQETKRVTGDETMPVQESSLEAGNHPFFQLPAEVIAEILKYLHLQDLFNLGCVSRDFKVNF